MNDGQGKTTVPADPDRRGGAAIRGQTMLAHMLPINPAALEVRTREQALAAVQAEDALRPPASALFRSGKGWAIPESVDGPSVRRQVEIGRNNGVPAEAPGGPEAGDVFLCPSTAVGDGTAIAQRMANQAVGIGRGRGRIRPATPQWRQSAIRRRQRRTCARSPTGTASGPTGRTPPPPHRSARPRSAATATAPAAPR